MKMSFVTAAMLRSSRRARQSWSIKAVFPEPTGLWKGARVSLYSCGHASAVVSALFVGAYPPIPTVKALSFQSRPAITGISR